MSTKLRIPRPKRVRIYTEEMGFLKNIEWKNIPTRKPIERDSIYNQLRVYE